MQGSMCIKRRLTDDIGVYACVMTESESFQGMPHRRTYATLEVSLASCNAFRVIAIRTSVIVAALWISTDLRCD